MAGQARVEHRASPYLRVDGRTLSGTAVLYGDRANLGWAEEEIRAGAFAPLSPDVRMTVQHDRGRLIARTGAGLTMVEGDDRLDFRAELIGTREADDVLLGVRHGLLRGVSVEMIVTEEEMRGDLRIVHKATLGGISVVDEPAYKGSVLTARWELIGAAPQPRARRRRLWQLL